MPVTQERLTAATSSEPFTILGEIPNGGPEGDDLNAISRDVPAADVPEVIRILHDVILTATGPRNGHESTIDPTTFDLGIRNARTRVYFQDPGISALDRKKYACRVVQRMLNSILGANIRVPGSYASERTTDVRAHGLYDAVEAAAISRGVTGLTPTDPQAPEAIRRRAAAASEAKQQDRWKKNLADSRTKRATRSSGGKPVGGLLHDVAASDGEVLEWDPARRAVARRPVRARSPATCSSAIESQTRPTAPNIHWSAAFADDATRKVFLHIAQHGSISEVEVTRFLGSPRAFRRFSLEFDDLVRRLPFAVRIEPAADGKRYVKEREQ